MKRFPDLIFLLFCCHVLCSLAFCSEDYYIDNQRVLLYKIINWWYDCTPEESVLLCRHPVRYENRENARMIYDGAENTLKLKVKGGFADLLSLVRPCEQCAGSPHFRCTWINRDYFGNGRPAIVSDITEFIFYDFRKQQVQKIQGIEKDILFVLEGMVGGLLNGKIALHPAGDLSRKCPGLSQNTEEHFPISLKIINADKNEILAEYAVIWEK